jgi:hypothetical protein
MDHTADYREIATIIVLKGGKDENGDDIVVQVENKTAIKQYGAWAKTISESVWTTETLAEARALQLLAYYSGPIVSVTLDAEPEVVSIGQSVTFVSSTLGIDDTFAIRNAGYTYSRNSEIMILELANRLLTISDLFEALERNLERR